jgi:hypothetical protein
MKSLSYGAGATHHNRNLLGTLQVVDVLEPKTHTQGQWSKNTANFYTIVLTCLQTLSNGEHTFELFEVFASQNSKKWRKVIDSVKKHNMVPEISGNFDIVSSESRRRCISPKSKFRYLTEYSQEEFETAIAKFMGKPLPKNPPDLFDSDK